MHGKDQIRLFFILDRQAFKMRSSSAELMNLLLPQPPKPHRRQSILKNALNVEIDSPAAETTTPRHAEVAKEPSDATLAANEGGSNWYSFIALAKISSILGIFYVSLRFLIISLVAQIKF